MKITSNIKNSNYTQWLTGFVESVINQADLKCEEVIIDDLDDKYMWLTIDGMEYIIRTWNFEPVTYDLQGRPCSERVSYTLFKQVSDENGSSHGEEVSHFSFKKPKICDHMLIALYNNNTDIFLKCFKKCPQDN